MDFWGAEVKPGKALKGEPGDNKFILLTVAGLASDIKGSQNVQLHVAYDGQNLDMGTFSKENPEALYDFDRFVFTKEFFLSHNSMNASVNVFGYEIESCKKDRAMEWLADLHPAHCRKTCANADQLKMDQQVPEYASSESCSSLERSCRDIARRLLSYVDDEEHKVMCQRYGVEDDGDPRKNLESFLTKKFLELDGSSDEETSPMSDVEVDEFDTIWESEDWQETPTPKKKNGTPKKGAADLASKPAVLERKVELLLPAGQETGPLNMYKALQSGSTTKHGARNRRAASI